jgi:phospholipid-translocating ATPase
MLFFLALLALYVCICFAGSFFYYNLFATHWYLAGREPKFFAQKIIYHLIEILFYISLFSNIIPISMYISIETQRFIGSKFFEWDIQ